MFLFARRATAKSGQTRKKY